MKNPRQNNNQYHNHFKFGGVFLFFLLFMFDEVQAEVSAPIYPKFIFYPLRS